MGYIPYLRPLFPQGNGLYGYTKPDWPLTKTDASNPPVEVEITYDTTGAATAMREGLDIVTPKGGIRRTEEGKQNWYFMGGSEHFQSLYSFERCSYSPSVSGVLNSSPNMGRDLFKLVFPVPMLCR
jgi:hypothetical protein